VIILIYLVRADGADETFIELVTKDISKALSMKMSVLEKECNFSIEAWENETKIGAIYWDDDMDAFGGSMIILDSIRSC
jgi:hypothetical protein